MNEQDDLLFEKMFATPDITDDGFSERVISRIHKQRWKRQLILTIAVFMGALIAFTSVLDILDSLVKLMADLPFTWSEIPVESMLNMPSIFIPLIAVVLMFLLIPIMDD